MAESLNGSGRETGETGETGLDRLISFSHVAYRLVVRRLGASEGAEDVLQQAYLAAAVQYRSGAVPADDRAWFLGIVANLARRRLRDEASRKRKEAAVVVCRKAAVSAESGELVGLLRQAMAALDEKYRLPVALHYEEGLSRSEIAVVLDLPERTVSHYIAAGLDRLRQCLTEAGYNAAPAVVIGALVHTAPPVPVGLAAAVKNYMSGQILAAGSQATPMSALEGVADPQKPGMITGGLFVKIGLSLAAVGLTTGAIFLAVGDSSGESPAPTERKSRFATPVWHPDAEWKDTGEVLAGSQATGNLDGPRQEVMWRWGGLGLSRCSGMRTAGRSDFVSYDPETERIHQMAGSGHGYLDGPFSRARFGGWDYSHRGTSTGSPDGRYVYFLDPWNGRALRGLDLEKQEVFTVRREPIPDLKGIVADGQGRLLALKSDGELLVFTPGKPEPGKSRLETPEGVYGGQTLCLVIDPVHNRLYCSPSFKMSAKWYLWYWDLADGKHHGVLPISPKEECRAYGSAGPFKGTAVYPEVYVGFGPDDPEYRFLYMRCTDMATLFRLDLLTKQVDGFTFDKGKGCFRFITEGVPNNGPARGMMSMVPEAPDGDFSWATEDYKGCRVYRIARVK